jgi:asparagine synthase (glutamine-hydrolysing)
MCGIWCSIGWQVSRSVIDIVANRGPDGDGWQTHESPAGIISLGHVRLAIFDTTTVGAQPFKATERGHTIVFNGAIFNFMALRHELQELGYVFRSRTDTEVILAAYAQWGIECLTRLNGMFSFVIVDREEQRIFAARDRFGIKPLYLYSDENGVAFASEIRQILSADRFQPRLNRRICRDFLLSGLLGHDAETLVQNVRQVQSGEYVIIKFDRPLRATKIEIKRWYVRPRPGAIELPEDEARRTFRDLFEDAVCLRMPADVPVGITLSGGLDSSAIAGVTAGLRDDIQMRSVSACYEDGKIDEREYIEVVERQTNILGHHVFPDPRKFMADVEAICRQMDAPFASTSIFSQWAVFRAAREIGLKVMLTGQGADEQLCGYMPMLNVMLSSHLRRGRLVAFSRDFTGHINLHRAPVVETLQRAFVGALPNYVTAFLRGRRLVSWLSRNFQQQGQKVDTIPGDIDKHIFAQVFQLSLPGLLQYQDRTSMMNGIESREPFLDHRLVEFLIGLGGKFKVRDGQTKWLLREGMGSVLPPQVRHRHSKIGFETPQVSWLNGALRPIVEAELATLCARFPDIFTENGVYELWGDVKNGHGALSSQLWRVVSFSIWSRQVGIVQ